MASQGKPQDYQPAQRTCLAPGCGKLFDSAGPGVRICPKCRVRAGDPKRSLSRRAAVQITDTRGG